MTQKCKDAKVERVAYSECCSQLVYVQTERVCVCVSQRQSAMSTWYAGHEFLDVDVELIVVR